MFDEGMLGIILSLLVLVLGFWAISRKEDTDARTGCGDNPSCEEEVQRVDGEAGGRKQR